MRRRWAKRLAAAAAAMVTIAGAAGYAVLTGAVPRSSGALAVPGLVAGVEIVRDREGVPHIFAGATADLAAALGLAHAQDRLWQMELSRRVVEGRLSEIFGREAIGTDIFMRTLDLYGHAERSLSALDAKSRAEIEAYARGVNAWIGRSTGLVEARLPPEFVILRHRPEPWRAADSVAVIKLMALLLSTNLGHEIRRLTLAARGLGPAEIEDLLPPLDRSAPPLPDLRELLPLRQLASSEGVPRPGDERRAVQFAELATAAIDALIGSGASNNWVLAGSRTRSGMPLLANDPHLALAAPSTWYLAHLALARSGQETANVVGATLPGVPSVVLGRSDRLAWGFTNTGADVQDVFIERVNPAEPNQYQTPDGWRRFASEQIEIRVKGEPPQTLVRRRTRHGPVLPEGYRGLSRMLPEGYVAALQWTALSDDDTTISAGLFDPALRTVEDFMARMARYVVPVQSMVVADVDGRIGLIAPGRVPIRDPANAVAGRAPVPGWDRRYDWQGFIPFEALPRVVDPPDGALGTSNTRIVGSDYPFPLTHDWDAGFRQQRLAELILRRSGHDVAAMQAAQLDAYSPFVARLKPLMIAAARKAGGADAAVLDRLEAWDATFAAAPAEPLVFVAWLRESLRAIYADDLGPAFVMVFDAESRALLALLEGRALGRDWCDDRTTPEREDCAGLIARALGAALRDLEQRYGADRARWSWGAAHVAHGEHRPFGEIALLARIFNVMPPSPGGPHTLNRGAVELASREPFHNRNAASLRAIYDLADLDRSLFIHSTGQSGNAFSRLYRAFAQRWATGRYITVPTGRQQIEARATGRWRLCPGQRAEDCR